MEEDIQKFVVHPVVKKDINIFYFFKEGHNVAKGGHNNFFLHADARKLCPPPPPTQMLLYAPEFSAYYFLPFFLITL